MARILNIGISSIDPFYTQSTQDKTMLKIFKYCLLIMTFAAATSSYASSLSEENINQFLSKVEKASASFDTQVIDKALSDDVKITMHVSMQGQKQTMTPSKQDYLAMGQQAKALYKNYQITRSNTVIKINGDQAFVTGDVTESMTMQGQNISANTKEELTIKVMNGNLVVTEMVGYSNM